MTKRIIGLAAGGSVEVEINGGDLEGLSALRFDQPGLSAEAIDELPEPGMIASFGDREMEAIQKRLTIQRIVQPRPRREIDWPQIRRLRSDNAEIERMFHWISYSLDNFKVESYAAFAAKDAAGLVPVVDNAEAIRHARGVVSPFLPES